MSDDTENQGFMTHAVITDTGGMVSKTPCCKVVIPFTLSSYLSRSCPECGLGYYAWPTSIVLGAPMVAWVGNGETNWGTR